MERSPRLRRYLRKDYTQRVEFPVEIVGRDNAVRRYSFDDAVRLYRRRMHTASSRYDDPETIDAEIRHCRQRIDQLRRSFIDHGGWEWARPGANRGVLGTPLAAEVGAFLGRVFPLELRREDPIPLEVVEIGTVDTCFARLGDESYLVYLYRLDGEDAAAMQERLRSDLERLRGGAPGAERCFAVQLSPDLAIVLAGTGTWRGAVITEAEGVGESAPPTGDSFRDGTRALHDGNLPLALSLFERGLDGEPSRLVLGQAAALAALLAGQPERAEFAARLALAHHPGDSRLQYALGVALLQARRVDEALAALAGDAAALALARGVALGAAGRWVRAWRELGRARRGATEDTWFIARMAALGRARIRGAALGVALAAAALGLAPLAAAQGKVLLALVAVAVAPIQFAVSRARVRVAFRRALSSPGAPLRLVSPELLPREAPGEVAH